MINLLPKLKRAEGKGTYINTRVNRDEKGVLSANVVHIVEIQGAHSPFKLTARHTHIQAKLP